MFTWRIVFSLFLLPLLFTNLVSAERNLDDGFSYETGDQVFSDIGENHWAYDYLNTADNIGLFELGAIDDSDETFRCNDVANRAEASKLVAIVFGSLDTEEFVDPTNHDFSDVTSGDWHYPHIEYLSSKGIIAGYSDGTFRPEALITRAEMAKIAAGFIFHLTEISDGLTLNLPEEGTQTFTDVTENDWYYQYIELLARDDEDFTFYEPLKGYSDGGFHPNGNVTRCEMVKMVAEASEVYQFTSALVELLNLSKT